MASLRRALVAVLAIAIGGAAAAAGAEATLVRGPYLQRAAPTAAIVRWRTSEPTDTLLFWGPAGGALDQLHFDPVQTSEHRIELSGLQPETRYGYLAGSSSGWLAGNDSGHTFATAPAPGAARPARFWAIGDSGVATAHQAAVRDAYLADAAGAATDVWLMLGDNAYDTGADAEYTSRLFAPYTEVLRDTCLWPTYGNHDAMSSDAATLSGPYFEAFSLPRWGQAGGLASGTEAFYAFEWGAAHFVVLDAAESSLAPASPMLAWLAGDLAANARPWTIVAVHHPPYTKGSHDSDDAGDSGGRMGAVRANVLPILEAHGVDLVLSGHSHSYERSFLLDGHYGESATLDPQTMVLDGGDGDPAGDGAYVKAAGADGGTVYAVVGSSARLDVGPLDHPAMAVALGVYGSLVLELDGDRLTGRFLDDSGVELDRFVLVEPGVPLFWDDFELGSLARWPIAGT